LQQHKASALGYVELYGYKPSSNTIYTPYTLDYSWKEYDSHYAAASITKGQGERFFYITTTPNYSSSYTNEMPIFGVQMATSGSFSMVFAYRMRTSND